MHLVMFDVDGTLVDNEHIEATLYNKAIKDVLDITLEDEWKTMTHVTDPGILVELVHIKENRMITDKEYDAVRDYFCDLLFDTIMEDPSTAVAMPGALELMKELEGRGDVQLAIATGAWGPAAALKLGTAGFDVQHIPMATGDDEAARTDIMMIAYERAIEKSEVEQFETITYIGDGKWDMRAAAELGWRFIGVGDMTKETDVWLENFADLKATREALNLVSIKE